MIGGFQPTDREIWRMTAYRWCDVCGNAMDPMGSNRFGCLSCYTASGPDWVERWIVDSIAPAGNIIDFRKWQKTLRGDAPKRAIVGRSVSNGSPYRPNESLHLASISTAGSSSYNPTSYETSNPTRYACEERSRMVKHRATAARCGSRHSVTGSSICCARSSCPSASVGFCVQK